MDIHILTPSTHPHTYSHLKLVQGLLEDMDVYRRALPGAQPTCLASSTVDLANPSVLFAAM